MPTRRACTYRLLNDVSPVGSNCKLRVFFQPPGQVLHGRCHRSAHLGRGMGNVSPALSPPGSLSLSLSLHICTHIPHTYTLKEMWFFFFLIKRSQAKTFLSGVRNHRENESPSRIYLLSISFIYDGHPFLSCQSVYIQFVRVSTSMSFLFRFLKWGKQHIRILLQKNKNTCL